jgi:hypothetical protein
MWLTARFKQGATRRTRSQTDNELCCEVSGDELSIQKTALPFFILIGPPQLSSVAPKNCNGVIPDRSNYLKAQFIADMRFSR